MLILVAGVVAAGHAAPVRAQEATPTAGSPARTDGATCCRSPDGLNPGLTATTTEAGVCAFPSSAALDRPDAWDCLGADGQLYDPCFENPFLPPTSRGRWPAWPPPSAPRSWCSP